MTNQEFLTEAYNHVMRQTERCANTSGCIYAGPNNTACAIGVFLPRELAERLDRECGYSNDINSVYKSYPEVRAIFGNVSLELLCLTQNIHDGAEGRDADSKEEIKTDFEELAQEFGLVLPE